MSVPRPLRSFLAFLLVLIPGAASAATFTLSPTSLSFGNQVLGTTSGAKTITLTNTGASVLAFTAVPSTGEFTATSTCSSAVSPGATCAITVRFTPSVLGTRSATLVVTDTASAGNTASASLTGKGVLATTLSTTSLSFGNVVRGATSAVKKVKLTNNQTVPLTGVTFTSSNPDFSATGCGATLAAGATCTESVTFTPTAAPGVSETGNLVITHSAVTSPQSVALAGKSVLPLTLSAGSLSFTSTAQGTTRTLSTLKLTNNQKIQLTNISYALAGPFTATGCTPPLGAGKSCTLSVTFAPTAAHIGLVTGSITISSTNPTAWNHPVANLSGTAILPILITPNPFVFPDTTVAATSAAKTISIKNQLTRSITFAASPFSFGGAAAADYALSTSACGATLAAGSTCSVKVTFHPHAGGTRAATFNVASDAPGSPHSSVLTGYGTTPITVSPTQLSFGNVGVGLASNAKIVTLQNNQSVAASITVNPPTGNFTKEPATTCGTTLAAGGSCTISVAMRPKVGGPQAGVLTILQPPFAAINVPLSGTGINAITTSVSSLGFAQQKIGTTSLSKQITVTNHQNVPASLGTALTGNFAATDACGGIVPALSTCVVSVTFTPLTVAPLTGSISFEDHVTATGRVPVNLSGTGTSSDPAPSIASVSPGAGTVGTVVNNVAIAGSYTTFTNGAPVVSFGGGVTVSGVTVLSDTSLVVGSVSIGAGAVPGPRNVQVTNGTTTASLTAGFVVSASAAQSFSSIAPDIGAQGQTLTVSIVGTNTHFAAGVTTANFGDNVYVNGAVQVIDQTHATANLTISPTAVPGWRAVTLVTGGEYATLTPVGVDGPGFHVVRSGAAVASITPASGEQGQSIPVTVVGTGTHFLQGATTLSLGAGINIGSVTVDSPTQLHATIVVAGGSPPAVPASPGLRDVTVTTGGEVALRAGAFTVTPSATTPYLAGVSPNSGQQGQTLTLALTGVNTHFTTDSPAPSLEIGSNITVNSLNILSDTTILANVSIALVADVGPRGAILSSGPTNYPFTFVVAPSAAAIVSVVPGSTGQGTSLAVTVTGIATHWSQDTTAAWFVPSYCPIPSIDRITVTGPTSAVLDITVPANGCVGANPFQMSTGGEIVTAALNVYRKSPSVSLSPSSAMVGSTVTLNFLGEFTHFAPGSTTAVIDGTGVQIQNFTVTGPASATAKFVIAPDAPAGSCYSALPGCHTVTVTSPVGTGSEILTTSFQVTSTPAVLVSIDPYHAAPGDSALVRIRGSYTHFLAGTTAVGFGPDISVGAPTIISPTELTVNVSLASSAAIGWRSAYVNTGTEQVTIGFRVDGPATPAIASVSPGSAAQGESLVVNITGQNTNFSAASELILGAGVTVANFSVTSPTTATAVVAVSPTAAVGPNAVIVLTPMGSDQEIASGAGFSVLRGPSQILSVTPSVATQSQVLNIALVGEGTHWLQGGSAADFGPGVVVNALTVTDATHAVAQITILSTAPLGFHTVSMQTDGEYVAMPQGLNVTEATPVLLNSSPNSGQQGTTFNVQVLGQQTHWQQGVTTASYGDGITVNSFTVLDSASGTINVTVDPLAFIDYAPACHNLTVTTGTEQVSLPSQLCVQPGAALVSTVTPHSSPKGQTLTVTVTGQNTHFTAGLTTADFGIGINTSAVTVTSPTTATVDLAVTSSAPNGYHSATMRTVGEIAYSQYAFIVGTGTPRLASAAPNAGQQGQSLTVRLLGEFTHWAPGSTTVTFGTGITVNAVTIVDATTADVAITIDPLTAIGPRTVTATTAALGEIVSASSFSVVAGPAIIANSVPQSGNQGQDIVLTLTGQNTHWAQGVTQFSMSGLGIDIKLNYFLVASPTSATAGITISPTASLGARSIYMITGGESLVSANAFIVTGGIPAIASVSPGSGKPGDTGLNVQIAGLYTHWDSTSTVDFGPGVTVQSITVNNSTSITAVVGIDIAAGLGARTVTVRTGAQALTGYFQVVSPTPPTPFIAYMSPSTGLRGQTFTVAFSGQYTHWDPATSTVTFGDPGTSGITINSFQVTSPSSARANITIGAAAPLGSRTVEIATGTELEQATFSVVVATPIISIVDPGSAMQGATLDLNVLGQNTTFDATTVFDFGSGIAVNSKTILGPTVAQVNVTISVLATLGGRSVSATTGTEVANSIYGFSVTPSLAIVRSVTPNTAKQRDTLDVNVVGENTHWDGTTKFYFGNGVSVTAQTVTSPTTATVTITLASLAQLGGHTVTAATGGEVASLNNAFIVQPGTPLILSSGPASGQQQQNVSLTILGQFTQWVNGTTTVSYGSGVTINSVNVTSPVSITVGASIEWWAQPGSRTLTVTTGDEALTLPGAFDVANGTAGLGSLNPATSGQGETHDVVVTGVNTHFTNGVTTGSFGPGISVNSVSVASPTSATVNITIAASANPGQNSVALYTQGETAGAVNAFTIVSTRAQIQYVSPVSAAQGTTLNVSVIGSLVTFGASTTFDFGPGITVNSKTIVDATHATVNITISPLAARTTRSVCATTGSTTACGTSLFTVTAGPAYISAISPNSGKQNKSGLVLTISGNQTHFLSATPTVTLGPGVTVTGVSVTSDTLMTATVNISPTAPVQTNDVTVTTLGEVAVLAGGFSVLTGDPVVTSAVPLSANQGVTLDVAITGLYTHFVNGTTQATFGAGISVNSVAVTGPTQATVNISISPSATTGSRNVTMTTGTEVATGLGVFSVLAAPPQIDTVNPTTGAQGSTQTLTITGSFTHFQSGVSTVSFSGSGVTAGVVTVNGPTQIQVPVTVSVGAAAGARTVTVTTGSEVVSKFSAFTVLDSPPQISVIDPNVGVPNSTVPVTVTGAFTHFVNGTTQARFGAGISVNGGAAGDFGFVNVTSATTATATLTIAAGATLGARDVRVQTGTEILDVNDGFTVQSTSPTAPGVTFVSPANGSSGVPTNTSVTLQFSAPLDRTTVSTANIRLVDIVAQGYCYSSYTTTTPGTVDVDASGRVVTFTPAAVLSVGRPYHVCVNYGQQGTAQSIKDPSGHDITAVLYSFTTGFTPDTTGPTLIAANIADGDSNVPTNAPVVLGFTRPINPATVPIGFSVTAGGSPVAGTVSYTADYRQVTFTPSPALAASTIYVVGFTTGLEDSVGNPLTNPGSITFTTGTSTDTSAPTLVSTTPGSGGVTGTEPTLRATFNEPLNPLRETTAVVYLYNAGTGYVQDGTVQVSADRKSVTLVPARPLDPGTAYSWFVTAYNMVGTASSYGWSFRTTGSADTTPPSVVKVSPPAGATVPLNVQPQVLFNEPIDPMLVSLGSTPSATFTFALSTDHQTLTFTPSPNLSASTAYTVTLNGVKDLSGNAMPPYVWNFTTSSAADTTAGTMTAAPTGSGVAASTPVVLSLSEAVNPATVNSTSFRIIDSTLGQDIGGTISASADLRTLTFTPTVPYVGGHTVCVYAGQFAFLKDFAGNNFSPVTACFNVAAGTTDSTPPTVVSVTPFDGATGIGPHNPVTVSFSESMRSTSLQGSVALYVGSDLASTSFNLAPDGTSLTFSYTMAYSTTYTVVVSPGATDLAGNSVAALFRSTFTTAPRPVTTRPQVVPPSRPASGATGVDPSASILFFLNQPIDPATVNGSVFVSQNGVLLTGTTATSHGNRVITFVPSAPFAPGALLEVWLTSGIADSAGNQLYDYQTSFRIAASLAGVAPAIVTYTPPYGGSAPSTTVMDIRFTKPINPATVTSSTFYMTTCGSTPVATTRQLLHDNTVLRLRPTAALPVGCYYYFITSALTDMSGLPVSNSLPIGFGGGVSGSYFNATSSVDTTGPTVVAAAPTNGAVNIGANAVVRLTFSEAIATYTIDPTTLTIEVGGSPIPYDLTSTSTNPDGTMVVRLTPGTALPASSSVTVSVTSGVTDFSGNPAVPFAASFTTAAAPDFSAPMVIASSVVTGDYDVPVTSVFTATFDRPMDLRSFVPNSTIYLYEPLTGTYRPHTLSFSADGTQVTLSPASPLAVGRSYSFTICSVVDLTGTTSGCFSATFTTALFAPSGGPAVVQVVPYEGLTVPVNFKPKVRFDRSISRTSLSAVTLTAGAVSIPFTTTFTTGDTIATLSPSAVLEPSTAYTLTIAGVTDIAGVAMSAPVVVHFATGAALDWTAPTVIAQTPPQSSAPGTNPVVRARFSEPIDPVRATSGYIYNNSTGRYVPGVSFVFAPQWTSVQASYLGPLAPNSSYTICLPIIYDLGGNYGGQPCWSVITSSGSDATPPTVISATPPDASAGVPRNATVAVRFSERIDPTSFGASSGISLSPAVAGTQQLSSDGLTLTFTPSANLNASTLYTVNAAGIADLGGNPLTAFSSTFTTGSLIDTTAGTINMTTPVPGSPSVSVTTPIVLTLNKAVNPTTVTPDSVQVSRAGTRLAGSVAIGAGGTTLTFTALSPLPPGALISVSAVSLRDLAGNVFGTLNSSFTTASVADTTPPYIVSISPANGATGIGPSVTVTIAFSESLDPATIKTTNFALYSGFTNLGASVSWSADNRMVMLNRTLPYDTEVTVVVDTDVTDVNGNPMAAPFQSTFTTLPEALSSTPSVTQMRPGNGATNVATTTLVTLYATDPIAPASVAGGAAVTQNGVAVSGSFAVSADGYALVFTPAAPFAPGALIQAFVTNQLTNTFGTPFQAYSGLFYTAPDLTGSPLQVVSYFPGYASTQPANTVIEVQFNKPIDPAYATSTYFWMTDSASNPVATAITQVQPNVLRMIPSATLTVGPYYYFHVSAAMRAADATTLGSQYDVYFYTSAVDTVAPLLQSVVPVHGATNVGDNATIRFSFNKIMDTPSINASTITLQSAGVPVPFSLSFGSTPAGTTAVSLTPQAPLADNSAIDVIFSTGIKDRVGQSIAAQTVTFQTGDGPDVTNPALLWRSPDPTQTTGVPTNTQTFTWVYDEPLSPAAAVPTNVYVYPTATGVPLPGTIALSGAGTTLTVTLASPLNPSTQYVACSSNPTDMTGNVGTTYCASFTTAATASVTGPQVITASPTAGLTGAPRNAWIEVVFDKAVDGTSVVAAGAITLKKGAVNVAFTPVWSSYFSGRAVHIIPAAVLDPNATYTVTITGVRDLAGVAMASPYAYSFTTGADLLFSETTLSSASALVGGVQTVLTPWPGSTTGVSRTAPIQVTFTDPVIAASIMNGGARIIVTATNEVIPVTVTLSADGKTASLTPASPLAATTQYQLQVNYAAALFNQAGYQISGYSIFNFTTTF